MTPTKLLISQIFVVFAIGIAGVWTATQWATFQLGYPVIRKARGYSRWVGKFAAGG